MSTATIRGIEHIVRDRILNFSSSLQGTDIKTLLGATTTGSGSDGKYFFSQAPDNLTGFWAIQRILDVIRLGMDGGFQMAVTFEVIFYGKPRKYEAVVSKMATIALEAWHGWSYTEVDGIIRATTDTLGPTPIPYQEPADRELVAYRLLLSARCTPNFLLQHAA